jgi:hypothetical protein
MRLVLALTLLFGGASAAAFAQPITFGSLSDPTEAQLDLQRGAIRLALMGGPSYIGGRWRAVGGAEAEGSIGPFAVALAGHLRVRPDGIYRPDASEAYDLLRLLRYARLEPTDVLPVYLRVGPIRRLTLESGLLVRDFATVASWDDRTVGAEASAIFPLFEVGGFTADVRPNNLVGAYAALQPFTALRSPRLQSFRMAAQVVHDLGLEEEENVTAIGADIQLDLISRREFGAGIIAGHARFLNYGHGTLAGVQAGAELFEIGLVRARLGLTLSSDGFIPGYFNAFYPVNNPRARIVSSNAYFRDHDTAQMVGTALPESAGGLSLFFEFRALAFDVFEFGQYIRRDYGGATGTYGIRFALTPERGRNLRFLFDLQRQGLHGFRDLFSDLVDEAILTFRIDYAATDLIHIFIRSRYGYEEVGELPDGTRRYLVQRRFEPMVGVVLRR